MEREQADRIVLRFGTAELPPEQLLPLIESVRESFCLSNRGYSTLGYARLCAARDRAARSIAPEHHWGPELLRCWDQAVQWYERFAAPPPH